MPITVRLSNKGMVWEKIFENEEAARPEVKVTMFQGDKAVPSAQPQAAPSAPLAASSSSQAPMAAVPGMSLRDDSRARGVAAWGAAGAARGGVSAPVAPREIDYAKFARLINESTGGGLFFNGLDEDSAAEERFVRQLFTVKGTSEELGKHYRQGSLSTFRDGAGHKAFGIGDGEVYVDSATSTPFSGIVDDAMGIKYIGRVDGPKAPNQSIHRYEIATENPSEVQYMLRDDSTHSYAIKTKQHAIEFIFDDRRKQPIQLRTAHPVFKIAK